MRQEALFLQWTRADFLCQRERYMLANSWLCPLSTLSEQSRQYPFHSVIRPFRGENMGLFWAGGEHSLPVIISFTLTTPWCVTFTWEMERWRSLLRKEPLTDGQFHMNVHGAAL